jgi:hypothetical protein
MSRPDPVAVGVQRREGLSHEPQTDLGLCSVVVPVVVHGEAQRTAVHKPLEEKKVASQVDLVSGVRLLAGTSGANVRAELRGVAFRDG